jgi:pimeloyl-ACP methyl ester carboxylesterase
MRGHGKSIAGIDGVSIAAAARDLAELLESLDLRRAVVVGHSMGGMELGRFLVDHTAIAKNRLKGGLFLATTANSMTGTVRTGGWARSIKTLNKVTAFGGDRQMKWGEDNRLALSLMASAFGPGVTRRMVDDQVRLQNEFPVGSNRQGSASIAEHNVEAKLRKCVGELENVEFSVVSGTHDRLTPPIHGRGIVNALPHASWHEVGTAGHNIMVEDPDVVIDAIAKLLR